MQRAVAKLCRAFSLGREPWREGQAYRDRRALLLRLWPYVYFNYRFAPGFSDHIESLLALTDAEGFSASLCELLQLHYLAGILGLRSQQLKHDEMFAAHFEDMQRGLIAVLEATGDTPAARIAAALSALRYYDVSYSWSSSSWLGGVSHYYSAKPLLYELRRRLERG